MHPSLLKLVVGRLVEPSVMLAVRDQHRARRIVAVATEEGRCRRSAPADVLS